MMCINKNVYLPKMEFIVHGWEKSENNLNNSYSTGAFRTEDNHIMPVFLKLKTILSSIQGGTT